MSTTISGTNGVTFPDSTSMQTGQQACKAWVNFNGTGTVAIRGSYNVSSITDNGTGDYSINFTNALPDATGCIVSMGVHDSGSYVTQPFASNDNTPLTTERARIDCLQPNNLSFVDGAYLYISIFR